MSNSSLSVKHYESALSSPTISEKSIKEVYLTNEHTFISERELQVLRLIADGFKAKEIAWKLHISIHTVNSHKINIMAKLEVTNIATMVSAGFRLGLLK